MSDESLPVRLDDAILRVLVRFFRRGSTVALEGGRLNVADLEYLRIQWALSPAVEELARYLLENRHEAQASCETVTCEGTATVRGRLAPARTVLRRQVTGDPSRVVYLEPRKSFTEGPNHVLGWVLGYAHHLLGRYVQLLAGSPDYTRRVRDLFRFVGSARHLKGVGDAIAGVNLRERPSAKSLAQAGKSRRALYLKAFDAYRVLTRIEVGDAGATNKLLSGSLVGPLEEWQRFELLLALRMSECLARALNVPLMLHPIRQGANQPLASFGPCDTYWQSRTPYSQFPAPEPSEVVVDQILQSYGVPAGSDRPDVVIADRERGRVVAIAEAKHVSSPTASWHEPFRDAATQLVRYSRLYGHLEEQGELLRRSLLAVSTFATDSESAPATAPTTASLQHLLVAELGAWVTRATNSFALPSGPS